MLPIVVGGVGSGDKELVGEVEADLSRAPVEVAVAETPSSDNDGFDEIEMMVEDFRCRKVGWTWDLG